MKKQKERIEIRLIRGEIRNKREKEERKKKLKRMKETERKKLKRVEKLPRCNALSKSHLQYSQVAIVHVLYC
jgi:hypothetical protein